MALTSGTVITEEWAEQVYREICEALEAAGLQDGAMADDVASAMRSLFGEPS